MSKIGNWLLDMQESAAELTKEQFISKWGEIHLDIWEEVNNPNDVDEIYYKNRTEDK